MADELKAMTRKKPTAAQSDYAALVHKLAEKQKLSDARVKAVIKDFFAAIADGLESGESVKIPGFGALHIRAVEARAATTEGGKARTAGKRIVFAPAKKFSAAAKVE